MATVPAPNSRSYGPEYGLEATRRLEAGFSIVYSENDSDDTTSGRDPMGVASWCGSSQITRYKPA